MKSMKAMICSQNETFCRRVEHELALWQETFCVCCVTERLSWDVLPRHEGAICFLDLQYADWHRYTPQNSATVMVASDDAQIIESYHHHPTALLFSDFSYAEFCEAMGRCYPFWRQYLQWLELSFHQEPVRLPLYQLNYAEADLQETVLYSTGVEMRAGASLVEIAEQLPPSLFLRCQKSFVVNISSIRELSEGSLIMTDGRSIPMEKERVSELTDAVSAWNAARGTELSLI